MRRGNPKGVRVGWQEGPDSELQGQGAPQRTTRVGRDDEALELRVLSSVL